MRDLRFSKLHSNRKRDTIRFMPVSLGPDEIVAVVRLDCTDAWEHNEIVTITSINPTMDILCPHCRIVECCDRPGWRSHFGMGAHFVRWERR